MNTQTHNNTNTLFIVVPLPQPAAVTTVNRKTARVRNLSKLGERDVIAKLHKSKRCRLILDSEVTALTEEASGCRITVQNNKNKDQQELSVCYMLVKIGYLPNTEFLQGQANGPALAREMGKILDDPDSAKKAAQSAECLHKLLAQPEERGIVDWLIQEGRLG